MKQYFQVNWINGMKVTSGHFIDIENYFINRIQRTNSGLVNKLSYGLLPSDEEDNNSPKFAISVRDSKLTILHGLIAVTPEGYLVEIPANLEFPIAKAVCPAQEYYLVLTIKPFTRIPYGEINEQENPVRYPESIPEYQFSFLTQRANALHTLGKLAVPLLKFRGESFEEDSSYIPPCASIQAHPVLIDVYGEVLAFFNEFELKVYELLKKPNITNRTMLVNLVNFLNPNKTAIDWYLQYQPPVYMFEKILQVARIINSSIEIQNIPVKEELRSLLSKLMMFRYDHMEIATAVAMTRSFIVNYSKFLPKDENIFGV